MIYLKRGNEFVKGADLLAIGVNESFIRDHDIHIFPACHVLGSVLVSKQYRVTCQLASVELQRHIILTER